MIHFYFLNKVRGLGATKEQQKARLVTHLSDIHTDASSRREGAVESTFKPSDLPQLSKQHKTGLSTIYLVYLERVSSVFLNTSTNGFKIPQASVANTYPALPPLQPTQA